jgi:hypothetical protein
MAFRSEATSRTPINRNGAHRIEVGEIHCDARRDRSADNQIERRCPAETLIHSFPPIEDLSQRIGGGARERWNRQQPGPYDPERIQHRGEPSRQRPERVGHLARGFGSLHPMSMQSQGRDQDDEEHHQIGEEGPHADIQSAIQQFGTSCAFPLLDRGASPVLLLLHFLRRLPEEEIRTDRRAEHGDDHRPRGASRGRARQKRGPCNRGPVWMNRDRRCEVGKQREGEPLEHPGHGAVGQPDGGPGDPTAEQHDPQV